MEKKHRSSFRRKKVKELFGKSDYSIVFHPKGLVIRHDPSAKHVFSILSFFLGILLIIFAIDAGSWRMVLFSGILIGLPLTLHNWNLPRKVVFSEYHNSIQVSYFNSKKLIRPEEEPEFIVDVETRTAFVSPFQEGYLDHHYVFRVLVSKTKSYTLFQLKSRGPIDDLITELAQDFSSLTVWKDTPES